MPSKLKRDWFVFFLLIIIVSLYFAPYLNMYLYRDEGNWVYGAERFYNGEILYRDFFDYTFPGIYFLMVTLYAIFGLKFVIARVVILIVNILAGFFIYLLSKRLKDSFWFASLCILFYLSMILPWWDSLSHNIISVTASLLTLYLFCKFIELGYRRINLILCGLSSALVMLFTQSLGFYVIMASNVFLILHNVLISKYESSVSSPPVDIKRIISQLAIYNLVIALFFLPVLAFFYAHSALGDMVYCTFTWVTKNYRLDYGRTAIPYFIEEMPIILAPLTNFSLGSVVSSLKQIFIGYSQVIGLLLTLGYISLKALWKREYIRSKAHYFLLFALTGSAMFVSALYNARDWQIRTMSIVGYMLFLFWLFEFFNIECTKPKWFRPKKLKFIFLGAIFIFLATDVFFDNLRDSLNLYNNHHEIQTYRGTLTADKQTIDHLSKLQKTIDQYTQPGEDIFMYYHQSLLYFIFNRHNPTRFNTIDFHYSPEQMNHVVKQLELSKPKIILRDNFPERRAQWRLALAYEDMIDNPLEKYIKQNYRLKQKLGSIKVYEIIAGTDD